MSIYRKDHEWSALYEEHRNGKTIPELSKKYNIHVQSMYTAFKRLNFTVIERTPDKGANYNHKFFNIIDSELKSYILGWIYSDGYITSRYRLGIKVQVGDEYIVNLMISSIAPNLKPMFEANVIGVQFTSPDIYNDLIKIGVQRNKSYVKFGLPVIDKSLMPHFIRGYFDGDGTISISIKNKTNWNICSVNELFLIEMKEYLISIGIRCTIYKESRIQNGFQDMYRLSFLGNIAERSISFHKLYDNSTYNLPRKFVKLCSLYGNTEEN